MCCLKATKETVAVSHGKNWPSSSLVTFVDPNQKKRCGLYRTCGNTMIISSAISADVKAVIN